MKSNIGRTDLIIRLVLGIVLLISGLVTGELFGLIGILPLTTALAGWCPLYALFGFSTNKQDISRVQ